MQWAVGIYNWARTEPRLIGLNPWYYAQIPPLPIPEVSWVGGGGVCICVCVGGWVGVCVCVAFCGISNIFMCVCVCVCVVVPLSTRNGWDAAAVGFVSQDWS